MSSGVWTKSFCCDSQYRLVLRLRILYGSGIPISPGVSVGIPSSENMDGPDGGLLKGSACAC